MFSLQKNSLFSALSGILLSVLVGSCAPPTPATTTNEASKKLTTILIEELKYPAVVKAFPNTVWVYLPLDGNMLELKAAAATPPPTVQVQEGFAIQNLAVTSKEKIFDIEYDIASIRKYPKNSSYAFSYSEEFSKKYSEVRSSIFRAYADLAKPPDFFVILLADIKTGLEIKTLLYFGDLKRGMSDPSFSEEFQRRNITDEPAGDTEIIGDKEGRHVKFREVSWEEFIRLQIQAQIRFQYQQSSLTAPDDVRAAIQKITAQVMTTYNFTDFEAVQFKDLGNNETVTVPKDELL